MWGAGTSADQIEISVTLLPRRGPILAELRLMVATDVPHLDRPPEGDDHLLRPVRVLAAGARAPRGSCSSATSLTEGQAEPAERASLVTPT